MPLNAGQFGNFIFSFPVPQHTAQNTPTHCHWFMEYYHLFVKIEDSLQALNWKKIVVFLSFVYMTDFLNTRFFRISSKRPSEMNSVAVHGCW